MNQKKQTSLDADNMSRIKGSGKPILWGEPPTGPLCEHGLEVSQCSICSG